MKNLSSLFPMRLRKAVVALRRPTAQIVNPRFTGWGMASSQKPPCTFEDVEGKYFSECNKQLVRLIECGSIDLTQFGERKNQIEWVIALQWRHYILQCTISRVIRVGNRQGKGISFSEFGVCDGLTSWFALQKASHMGYSPTIDLYDAWSAMRPVDLLPSELARVGDYAYLSLDNTKRI